MDFQKKSRVSALSCSVVTVICFLEAGCKFEPIRDTYQSATVRTLLITPEMLDLGDFISVHIISREAT